MPRNLWNIQSFEKFPKFLFSSKVLLLSGHDNDEENFSRKNRFCNFSCWPFRQKKCQTKKPHLKLINFQIVNQGYVPSFRERTMQSYVFRNSFREKCENFRSHCANFFARLRIFSWKWIKRKNAKTMRNFAKIIFAQTDCSCETHSCNNYLRKKLVEFTALRTRHYTIINHFSSVFFCRIFAFFPKNFHICFFFAKFSYFIFRVNLAFFRETD